MEKHAVQQRHAQNRVKDRQAMAPWGGLHFKQKHVKIKPMEIQTILV